MLAFQILSPIIASITSTLGRIKLASPVPIHPAPQMAPNISQPITETEVRDRLRPHMTLGPALCYLRKEFRERPFTNGTVIASLLSIGALDLLKKAEIATVLKTHGTIFEPVGQALQSAGLGNIVMMAGLGLGAYFMSKGWRAATRLIDGHDRTKLHQAQIDYGSGVLSIGMILITMAALHGFHLEDNLSSRGSTTLKLLMTLGHSGDELMATMAVLKLIRGMRLFRANP